jgi:hypothetical protein
MSLLRRSFGMLLLIACLVSGRANAAATTNFSDQWWIPDESGWGASVLQQWDTLFIDLFVYGTDNKPTWFVAAATLQSATAGHVVFSGDLYATSGGANFGAPFNRATVSAQGGHADVRRHGPPAPTSPTPSTARRSSSQ